MPALRNHGLHCYGLYSYGMYRRVDTQKPRHLYVWPIHLWHVACIVMVSEITVTILIAYIVMAYTVMTCTVMVNGTCTALKYYALNELCQQTLLHKWNADCIYRSSKTAARPGSPWPQHAPGLGDSGPGKAAITTMLS